MIAAITKQEVDNKIKERVFPDFVIQAFNELIHETKLKNSSIIYQDEAVARILKMAPEYSKNDVFDNHWLDIEEFYKKAGWDVVFYKQPYYESSPSYWTFS